jgi:CheY-like chemotaxis protein
VSVGIHDLDILVVDDRADALELVRQLLENAGDSVRAAAGGRDALEAFDTRPSRPLTALS